MSNDLTKITTAKIWYRFDRNVQLFSPDESWWISYNPSTDQGAETAIVTNGSYRILLGDWRNDYEKIIDSGLESCIRFFLEHQDYVSPWSDRESAPPKSEATGGDDE